MGLIYKALESLLRGQQEITERLNALVPSIKELGDRLAKAEAKLPQDPPPAGVLVLAKLEYPNDKVYYSVLYHDGAQWRRQGGGRLFSGGYFYDGAVRRPFTRDAKVLSWKTIEELPA